MTAEFLCSLWIYLRAENSCALSAWHLLQKQQPLLQAKRAEPGRDPSLLWNQGLWAVDTSFCRAQCLLLPSPGHSPHGPFPFKELSPCLIHGPGHMLCTTRSQAPRFSYCRCWQLAALLRPGHPCSAASGRVTGALKDWALRLTTWSFKPACPLSFFNWSIIDM